MNKKICFTGWLAGLMIFTACASVQDFVKSSIQKPEVEFAGARLSGLSFDAVDLLFDVKISNPNAVGLTLAGFDYDFSLNDNSFLKGEQDSGVEIPSHGENVFQIPLSLNFSDLYNTFTGLSQKDSTSYRMETGVTVNLPVLGLTRIPINKEGHIPLLKLPQLTVEALQVNRLNLTGADLNLKLNLENPNPLSFALRGLNYQLEINDNQWATGRSEQTMNIGSNETQSLEIPISLNFLQMGQTAFQLLQGSSTVAYHFSGNFDLASSHPLLQQVNLPLERTGELRIVR